MNSRNANVRSAVCGINPAADSGGLGAASPLLAIAPGPAHVVRSSEALAWEGVLLERHRCLPGERISASIDRHVISMFHGTPSRFEHRGVSGQFVGSLARPRSIMITPAGPVPDVRLRTPAEFTHCALDGKFTSRVVEELACGVVEPIFRVGVRDRSIEHILGMLMDELETEQPLGRLYVDSLAYALAAQYLSFDLNRTCRPESTAPGLVPRVLNRVRERIEANLDADLSLESLAGESGYSRSHFLRMFRRATGLTPHQYVLDLRLKRAQERLRQAGSTIIDVAMSCGFSSQSHMTSVFRQRLAMTPGEYRRSA